MKWSTYIIIYLFYFTSVKAQLTDFSSYVNPMIGTGGHGHTFPGATLPFAMVQLSPDTRIDGSWDGCSAYHYSDSIIYGFSNTHLSGTGCSDYGDVMLMPTNGVSKIIPNNYATAFSHSNEKAEAGYYAVKLSNEINVQLTATTRVGLQKYTFINKGNKTVILDLLHRDKLLEGSIKIVNNTTIEGIRRSEAWAKNQTVYYRIEFSKPFINSIINYQEKNNSGAVFTFDIKQNEDLLAKVAISNVSTKGAAANMAAELPNFDFEKVRIAAKNSWNAELNKIQITSKDVNKMTVFYTALYHTMIQPNVNMDVDGTYRGMDNQIHKAEGYTHYTVFSLWDTFRAAHPLYTLIDRKRSLDFIKTFLAQYNESGRLPIWELSNNETDCMIGYHSASVISDAALKGITDFDLQLALDAMKQTANSEQFGLPAYISHGYLSMEDEHESVSKTVEYAYDDWCIAQFAKMMNQKNDYETYMKRSQSWKNVFDTKTNFMRPKKNGTWLSSFEPREVNNNFTEANSWQYTFFVPHDIVGLIQKMGGMDNFESKLDEFFSITSKTTGREQADITGLIGQYAHGNEPSHHISYLYDYIGKPYKTQQKIHQIISSFYTATPDGLIGNEDCGQMSAWFVLSSLGFYQVAPCSNQFMIGTPYFEKAKLNFENGKSFSIEANNLSNTNFYVNAMKLNGTASFDSYLGYSSIMKGGNFIFEMADNPSTIPVAIPQAEINKFEIITVPIIEASKRIFKDELNTTINDDCTNCDIFYTLDSTNPTKSSIRYSKEINITKTSTIKAIAIDKSGKKSNFSTATFYKMPHPDWKIEINSTYNPQYTAGGDEGIIDGIRGDANWRKGQWQGYQSQDFECIIDLGKNQNVSLFNAEFLQDTRSWILMPTKVMFYTSEDNLHFSLATTIENTIKDTDLESQIKRFNSKLNKPLTARYVKILATNYGVLPMWHQGAGGDAFIFIDEIEIE